ncbi:MAG: branched-chain amino acid transaminase [Candidatus Eutrophobiaceae bacterium]
MTQLTDMNEDGLIWLDGEFVPWPDARVHVLTHTLHYGMGVFEGIRAYKTENGTALFRLDEHIHRLFQSAHILNMQIPHTPSELREVCLDAVRMNKLDCAYIRPMCFLGSEGMGLRADCLKVHTMIAAWAWDAYLGEEGMKHGIKVKTSSLTRHHVNIALCKAKANGHYLNSILALQEALACGCEEALLLDPEGYAAEGSGENLFVVRNGTLNTPDPTSALEGITRDTIMKLAQKRNIPVVEKRITRDEIYIAAEAFFTGTAAEVTPIKSLDGRKIGMGKGTPGVITYALQQDYFNCVTGKLPEHLSWLSYV